MLLSATTVELRSSNQIRTSTFNIFGLLTHPFFHVSPILFLPGLACKHCFGGYGSGRFFPSSIKTLSDTSKTLNVLHNHMMRCRKCPAEIREKLEQLRGSHDEERAKMKFGSQKAFFARIWERLHGKGFPVQLKREENGSAVKAATQKGSRKSANTHDDNEGESQSSVKQKRSIPKAQRSPKQKPKSSQKHQIKEEATEKEPSDSGAKRQKVTEANDYATF
jgi:hypothetical protein